MNLRKGSAFIGVALSVFVFSAQAQAHWCDDLWASSYNIVVRPDSDTSPKNVYVQNNMGYQLQNFILTASGGVTLTAPTTLKVSGTLLPGEKGTWKISAGSPAKIEDITFSVSFGNSGQTNCYPTKGAKAVMVVKADGTLYPTGTLPGLDSTTSPGLPCTGDMIQGQSLQDQAIADFEDVNAGLDKLTQHYCAGRGSWDTRSGKTVTTFCPSATAAPSCPTTAPSSGSGSKYDYMHLWGAGELAIRKTSLGTRAAAVRAGLICGVNDADTSFAGYTLFVLGYIGDDGTGTQKSFIQSKATAGGDLGTIAKAALYLMGDTAQKADVQAGAKASSTFVKAACAAALGIVDKDDATVTSTLLPLVSWTEPDGGDGGKAMYSVHLLELVAFDRRGWVSKGVGSGAVTFYGETGSGAGGSSGTGGVVGAGGVVGSGGVSGAGGVNTGNKDASVGSDAKPSTGGVSGSGGTGGATGVGGVTGSGGKAASGGATGTSNSGGVVGAGGKAGSGGAAGSGAAVGAGGSNAVPSGGAAGSSSGELGGTGGPGTAPGSGGAGSGGDSTPVASQSSGCSCNFGSHSPSASTFYALALVGLALLFARRRRS